MRMSRRPRVLSLAVAGVLAMGLAASAPPIRAQGAAGPVLLAVELQPEDPTPGGQFVWIGNPSASSLDLSCWRLRSQSRTMVIAPGVLVPAGAVIKLTPDRAWLGKTDRVQLFGPGNALVDQTPELRDEQFDDQVWFRTPAGEWTFGRTRLDRKALDGHLISETLSGC